MNIIYINYIDYFIAISLFYQWVSYSSVMSQTAYRRIFNMKSKNKSLTLNEKIKLIESSEKDKLTVKQICELCKCGKSQV